MILRAQISTFFSNLCVSHPKMFIEVVEVGIADYPFLSTIEIVYRISRVTKGVQLNRLEVLK